MFVDCTCSLRHCCIAIDAVRANNVLEYASRCNGWWPEYPRLQLLRLRRVETEFNTALASHGKKKEGIVGSIQLA